MAFDAKAYRDPAITVRYERERQPCYGCRFIAYLLGKKYCIKGFAMKKKCGLWKESE